MKKHIWIGWIVLLVVLAAPQAIAQSKPKYRSVELAELQGIAKAAKVAQVSDGVGDSYTMHVPKNLRLHAAFEGPIGPFSTAYVYLKPAGDTDAQIWIIAKHGGEWKAYAPVVLDGLHEAKAVFFDDIGNDGQQEVFLIYSYMTGMGGARDHDAVVGLEWDEQKNRFESRPNWFDGGKDLTTAKKVRAHLASKVGIKSGVQPSKKTASSKKSTTTTRTRTPTKSRSSSRSAKSSAKKSGKAAEFTPFLPPSDHKIKGWEVEETNGKRCFFVMYETNIPFFGSSLTVGDLMEHYSKVAEGLGYKLASEHRKNGQPTRLFKRGADKVQIKIGHGRGNYTVKINYGDWHCSG